MAFIGNKEQDGGPLGEVHRGIDFWRKLLISFSEYTVYVAKPLCFICYLGQKFIPPFFPYLGYLEFSFYLPWLETVSKLNFHFTSSVKVSLGSSSSPSWLLCVSAELCANARWLHYTVSHALHDGYKLPKIRGCFPYPWGWWPWIRSLTSMRLFSLSATPQVGDGDLLK